MIPIQVVYDGMAHGTRGTCGTQPIGPPRVSGMALVTFGLLHNQNYSSLYDPITTSYTGCCDTPATTWSAVFAQPSTGWTAC